MDAIAPLEVPLHLVKNDYTSQEPITLSIPSRNISLLGHDYNITNAKTGEVVLKVKGRPISFRSTQTFCSADGKDRLFHIKYYNGERPHFEGQRLDMIDVSCDWSSDNLAIFAVYEKESAQGELTRQAQIYLPSNTTERLGVIRGPRFIVRGDLDSECEIVLRSTGQVLAVLRQLGGDAAERGRTLPTDPATAVHPNFELTVAPGMDYAAMAGIATSFNQLHNRSLAGSQAHSRPQSRAASRSRGPSRSASRAGSRAASPSRAPPVDSKSMLFSN